jgi:hypothetical protein
LGYRGFGLGVTSQQQKIAKVQRRKKMQLVGHLPTKLQPSTQTTMKGKGLSWVLMAKGKERKI